MAQQTLILDNGACSIKAGYLADQESRIVPNAIFKTKKDRTRIYIGDEVDECQDRSSMYFVLPFERGYLVNWDTQLQIWNKFFDKDRLNVDFENCRLVLTDPNEIARAFNDNIEEIVFENFCFHSLLKTSVPSCVAAFHANIDHVSCIVVDSGHSFTHIVPLIQSKIVKEGVYRIDVGGKALTNQLKDWISYRQLNVMDETYVINCCKEDCCFVSTDFEKDMQKWRANRVDYILPDFVNLLRGQVKEEQMDVKSYEIDSQKLTLGIERFSLPEMLFNPTDVEVGQMGIVEAIHASLRKFPKEIQLIMARNILLVGGNSLFAGYRKRIEMDLRSMVDDQFSLQIFRPPDPITYPWECARNALQPTTTSEFCQAFAKKFVSRAEYEENGVGICRKRFENYWIPDADYLL